MKRTVLIIAACFTLSACGTPAPVAFFVVGATGAAINVENSGDPVDDIGEAKDRIVGDIREGYGRDHFVSHELNR